MARRRGFGSKNARMMLLASAGVLVFALAPAGSVQAGACSAPFGTDGDDVLDGDASVNYLCGFAGDDILHGLEDDDVLYGGLGKDHALGGPGDDYVGEGNPEGGRDVLKGGLDDDYLIGGKARDRYAGGGGNDCISAKDGVDEVIRGGPGQDAALADNGDTLKSIERSFSTCVT